MKILSCFIGLILFCSVGFAAQTGGGGSGSGYTKAQSDARYVEIAGDTMTGTLEIDGQLTVEGYVYCNLRLYIGSQYIQEDTTYNDTLRMDTYLGLWAPNYIHYGGYSTANPRISKTQSNGGVYALQFTPCSTNNVFVFAANANRDKAHDHGVQANPTVFIHSKLNPDTNNTRWGSLTHSGTAGAAGEFIISTGAGDIKFEATLEAGARIGLSNSGITHPFTDLWSTNVYGGLFPNSDSTGGLVIDGLSDMGSASGMMIRGFIGSTNPTDTVAAVGFRAGKSDGSTGEADLGALETAYQFSNSDNSVKYMTMLAGGKVFINDIANGKMTQGLTINQGASDDEILSLKSSDVTHSMTNLAESDTYFSLKKLDAGSGGVNIRGLSDADHPGLVFQGVIGTAEPTNSNPAIKFQGMKYNGATGAGGMADDETVLAVQNGGTVVLAILGDGSVGVGTTEPTSKLQVMGTIEATLGISGPIEGQSVDVVVSSEAIEDGELIILTFDFVPSKIILDSHVSSKHETTFEPGIMNGTAIITITGTDTCTTIYNGASLYENNTNWATYSTMDQTAYAVAGYGGSTGVSTAHCEGVATWNTSNKQITLTFAVTSMEVGGCAVGVTGAAYK